MPAPCCFCPCPSLLPTFPAPTPYLLPAQPKPHPTPFPMPKDMHICLAHTLLLLHKTHCLLLLLHTLHALFFLPLLHAHLPTCIFLYSYTTTTTTTLLCVKLQGGLVDYSARPFPAQLLQFSVHSDSMMMEKTFSCRKFSHLTPFCLLHPACPLCMPATPYHLPLF